MNKQIVLIIGHNNTSRGAYSPFLSMTEYEYHVKVCELVQKELPDIKVLHRYNHNSHTREMKDVIDRLNKENYDLALELHFNSFHNVKAEGTETLIFHKNEKAKKYSEIYFNTILKYIPGQKIRGIVPVRDITDRGAYGIIKSKGTYILLEGFFGSNPKDSIPVEKYSRILIDFMKEVDKLHE